MKKFEKTVEALKTLQPLEKTHFWRPIVAPKYELLKNHSKLLPNLVSELVRITGTINLHFDWSTTEPQIEELLELGDKSTIGVFFPAYHRIVNDYLAYVEDKLTLLNSYDFNNRDIQFDIDTETLHINRDIDNQEIERKHNDIYWLIKKFFPHAKVVRYSHFIGGLRGASNSGWSEQKYYTMHEHHDSIWAFPFYRPGDTFGEREYFRRIAKAAKENNIYHLQPYLTLGEGFNVGWGNNKKATEFGVWSNDHLDIAHSHLWGRIFNVPWFSQAIRHERYGPFDMCKSIYLWKAGRTSWDSEYYKNHFMAYVKGSHDESIEIAEIMNDRFENYEI